MGNDCAEAQGRRISAAAHLSCDVLLRQVSHVLREELFQKEKRKRTVPSKPSFAPPVCCSLSIYHHALLSTSPWHRSKTPQIRSILGPFRKYAPLPSF